MVFVEFKKVPGKSWHKVVNKIQPWFEVVLLNKLFKYEVPGYPGEVPLLNSNYKVFIQFFLQKTVKNLKITHKFCYSTFPMCFRGFTNNKCQNEWKTCEVL